MIIIIRHMGIHFSSIGLLENSVKYSLGPLDKVPLSYLSLMSGLLVYNYHQGPPVGPQFDGRDLSILIQGRNEGEHLLREDSGPPLFTVKGHLPSSTVLKSSPKVGDWIGTFVLIQMS